MFNRHGVDKDERALQIEREMVEGLSRDRDDELAILERNIYARLKDLILGKTAVKGPKGVKAGATINDELLGTLSRGQWWQLALGDAPTRRPRRRCTASSSRRRRRSSGGSRTRSRRSAAATTCRRA